MTSITKPRIRIPKLDRNALGLTRMDYEGSMSTLCAGCGHDSITAALTHAFFELALPPHRAVKLSGIGCSSKTTAYFLSQAHGFNGVHGRMPAVASGANAAHQELTYIGISGDGDSLSIGLGQLCHAIRRNVNMLYVLENNGVYGLTKGQFSASSDVGSKSKKGEPNQDGPIDPVAMALTLGATFVARSFSGDKEQLVPIMMAGLRHRGFAFVDVLSPCVTFNDHEGSTKSYTFIRKSNSEVVGTGFVPIQEQISTQYEPGSVRPVTVHDGTTLYLRKVDASYDPTDRSMAYAYLKEHQDRGEIATGLLYIQEDSADLHAREKTVATPLRDLTFESLCPGAAALEDLMDEYI
ncbi:MAG TPA: 2-oxoglutarate ferredoxin oxidoreductase subunit beta [Gemmatimonadetes bacterium]|nr:2-oxoglutarate ferredoxin oxidoreductase subunit beta [Gemmatimonadota bacterium]